MGKNNKKMTPEKKTKPPAIIDEDLIKKHIPLVKKMARRIASRAPASIVADDLFSAGLLGLMDSVLNNNGGEGSSFSCYMKMRIRGAIYDEMRTSDWLPRKSRERENMQKREGPARPVAVVRFEDLPPGKESNPASNDLNSNPFNVLDRKRSSEKFANALNSIPRRDRLVLHLYYYRGMQRGGISRLLGVSESRISQIHHRALSKIRPILER